VSAPAQSPVDRFGSAEALLRRFVERCSFPPAGTVVSCGVSGGADSLALMVLAVTAGCQVTAVHVDHGLRPHSDQEAYAVEAAAARFGARFDRRTVAVRPGPNLEARARSARLDALPEGTLLGHTADDRAETILLNLLRGAGLDGLSSMTIDRHPLLALRRAETHSLCEAVGITPFEDPSNRDPAHRRNRIRLEVMPLLDGVAQRDVVTVLCRQADLLADERRFLDDAAAAIDPTDAKALSQAPAPLARRAIRRWLADPYPPDAACVERVLAVARGSSIACDIPGGRRVVRSRQRLSVVVRPSR
jgi:tRNA(Ile)-lysidine synthase